MAAAASRDPESVNDADWAGAVSLTETAPLSIIPAESIEIRVEHAAQLFDTPDPFPFREKGLDPAAEKYIVDWARELGRDRPLRIVIHLPVKESGNGRGSELARAFENFFKYRAGVVAGDLKDLFHIGRRSLSIGILVLAVCLIVARSIPSSPQASAFGWILRENQLPARVCAPSRPRGKGHAAPLQWTIPVSLSLERLGASQ